MSERFVIAGTDEGSVLGILHAAPIWKMFAVRGFGTRMGIERAAGGFDISAPMVFQTSAKQHVCFRECRATAGAAEIASDLSWHRAGRNES